MRKKKDIPIEEKSYAALFFILCGLLGLITIWGFWDETVTRRPWKKIQKDFYQYEYEKTKIALDRAKQDLPQIPEPEQLDDKRLSVLQKTVSNAKIQLDDALQERKFEQSQSDAINYKYQLALHEGAEHGANQVAEKWKQKLDEFDQRIGGELTEAVIKEQKNLATAYNALAEFYTEHGHHEEALSELSRAKKYGSVDEALTEEINTKMAVVVEAINASKADKAKHDTVAEVEEKFDSLSGIKRTFVGSLLENPFTKTREIKQQYLEDFDYTADRCETCHFAADKSGYERFAKETFEIGESDEETEGDDAEKSVPYQLMHPRVTKGSETVLIDGDEAEPEDYELDEKGLMTFKNEDVVEFGAEIEVSYETDYDTVLRTHPHREVLLGKHPVKRFGCVPCHGGQGQALTVASAHALDHKKEYWLTPVLGLDEHTGKSSDEHRGYMETNCRRCHSEVMMLDHPSPETGALQDYAPNLSKGMAVFEDLGCHGCHAVEGYPILKELDKVGPSLAKVSSKVNSVDWLTGWIKNPSAYLPETKMPRLFPTDDMTKMVYLTNGRKREGIVRREPGSEIIFVRAGDGTEHIYSANEVVEIVDIVKSIAVYLEQMKDPELDQNDATFSTAPRAIAAGETLVKTVGCLSCHTVGGLGSDFAPALEGVGNKLRPNFLRQWIRDPKSFDPKTVMPDLRLSEREVNNVVAYLMSLKGTLPPPPQSEESYGDLQVKIDPELGKTYVQTYGCFGCHDIPGFENEPKVGADLGEFGAKTVEELDFGDTTEIEHTWHGWTVGKVTNPRRYQTRRIISRMPVFSEQTMSKENALALAVLLKSFQPEKYPLSYIHNLSNKAQHIDAGRRLVKKYNCQGCHELEGKGGDFVNVVAAHKGLDNLQAKQFAPPTLQAEGAKVYPEWLFAFLKEPTSIRYGLEVRMPTFGLSDEDATALVTYFSELSDEPFPYETIAPVATSRAEIRTGKQIFDSLQCISCHPEQGETIPDGSDKTGRPDLALAKQRLKADWIIDWLKDPQSFQPGTAMPQAWPKIQGKHEPVGEFAGGDAEKQIQLVRDYLLSLGE